jgi:hypothetical protein
MDSDDESDHLSTGSNGSTNTSHAARTNHLDMQLSVVCKFITTTALQMCSYLQLLLLLCHLVPLLRSRNRKKRKQKPNVHWDRSSDKTFIHFWSDKMFKQQFQLTQQDFFLENMARIRKASSFAIRSSGSLILLELRLCVTLQILSGASYLDMIWYAIEIQSIPVVCWRIICVIDDALDSINFPMD